MAPTDAEQLADDIASTHTWLMTTLFCISLFESVFRPDPTNVIALFGFYGTSHRSAAAMRSFGIFLALTLVVDGLWFFTFEPFPSLSMESFMEVSRSGQMALVLSLVSVLYKLIILPVSVRLYRAYAAEAQTADDGLNGELSVGGRKEGGGPPASR
mmetsp:Transcript_5437/g.13423  ORF Transcript_5437/g.13423 Transcript_5437/m.13423 type:complete len:156 (-) Transcript_5437:117-584(-)